MILDGALVRHAYAETLADLRRVVALVDADRWDRPSGCGVWSIRELVAHMRRSVVLPGQYLDAPPTTDRVLADAVDYYEVALAIPDAHEQIARRGRDAALVLGDPPGELEVDIQQAVAAVAGAADDDTVATPFGQMSLRDYLATRVVELTVHTLDLCRALGQPYDVHPAVAEVTLNVLVRLGPAAPLIAALTGRGTLPDGFNVLG